MSQFGTDPTPPMHSDFDTSGEPPAWPKVVGIISIVWASLGMLCNLCGMVSPLLQGAMVNMVPPEQQAQVKAQMAASQNGLSILSAALGFLASILLLVAGIQTVRRRAAGRPLHLGWSVISVLLAILGAFVGWQNMQQQMQSMQSGPNAPPNAAGAQGVATVMFVCIMLFVLIYPVFCLIWFGMMGKRPETNAPLQEPIV